MIKGDPKCLDCKGLGILDGDGHAFACHCTLRITAEQSKKAREHRYVVVQKARDQGIPALAFGVDDSTVFIQAKDLEKLIFTDREREIICMSLTAYCHSIIPDSVSPEVHAILERFQ